MTERVTRRSVLGVTLAGLLSRPHLGSAHQELGKIVPDGPLQGLPALPAKRAEWPAMILTFADIAGYCAAAGIEQPRTFDDETSPLWLEMSRRVPLNDGVLFSALQDDWTELIGFSPMDVDRVAVAFDAPDQVRIYTGTFDPDRIARQFVAQDYDKYQNEGITVLNSPSDDIDLSSDLDRRSLGNFHHIAATETRVIATRSAERLDATLSVIAGAGESLAESAALDDIGRLIPDLHGYVLLNGEVLDSAGMGPGMPATSESIPPATLFLAGYTATADGQSVLLVADVGDAAAADAAGAEIETRIETLVSPVANRPYAEVLAGYVVEVPPDTGLVYVTVPDDQFATRWMQMLFARDLLFMATN